MKGDRSQTITVGRDSNAREICYIHEAARKKGAPSLFWLAGFMSDMTSTKATALADFARRTGFGCTRFDYSGHGASGSEFCNGTIGRWLEEARAVFEAATRGPQIVVGSSMGGHIALILLQELLRVAPSEAARMKGLVLIAPAWDMTEELMWKQFPPSVRQDINVRGFHLLASAYGAPYPITRSLIEEGRRHLLARKPFDPGRPVVILQGLLDADVPAQHARELLSFMKGHSVSLIEIPDGEHRLSRPEDLRKIFSAVQTIAAA